MTSGTQPTNAGTHQGQPRKTATNRCLCYGPATNQGRYLLAATGSERTRCELCDTHRTQTGTTATTDGGASTWNSGARSGYVSWVPCPQSVRQTPSLCCTCPGCGWREGRSRAARTCAWTTPWFASTAWTAKSPTGKAMLHVYLNSLLVVKSEKKEEKTQKETKQSENQAKAKTSKQTNKHTNKQLNFRSDLTTFSPYK